MEHHHPPSASAAREPLTASVVIPTYNRVTKLTRLLACLCEQADSSLVQVLVCNDGSSDDTEDRVHELASRFSARGTSLVHLFQPDQGFRAGQARNLGLAQAVGDVIIFIDDDLVVASDFVSSHVAAHLAAAGPRIAVGFRHRTFSTLVGRPRWKDIVASEPDDRASVLGPEAQALREHSTPWFYAYSCNMSVSGLPSGFGFDDAFVGWGMEDLDFGYRLYQAGAEVVFAPRARALHLEAPTPRDPFRCEVRELQPSYDTYVRNAVYFLDKHPRDSALRRLILQDLRWYLRDPKTGHWVKNGHENDVQVVLETCRAERTSRAGPNRKTA